MREMLWKESPPYPVVCFLLPVCRARPAPAEDLWREALSAESREGGVGTEAADRRHLAYLPGFRDPGAFRCPAPLFLFPKGSSRPCPAALPPKKPPKPPGKSSRDTDITSNDPSLATPPYSLQMPTGGRGRDHNRCRVSSPHGVQASRKRPASTVFLNILETAVRSHATITTDLQTGRLRSGGVPQHLP